MSDVFEGLGRALRGPADVRPARPGGLAEAVSAVAQHPSRQHALLLIGWATDGFVAAVADGRARLRRNELDRPLTRMHDWPWMERFWACLCN